MTHVDLPARRIVGLAVRTSYDTAGHDAAALWQRALASGLPAAGRPIVTVYTRYDSDHLGAYTMIVGVESDAPPGPGEDVADIPAGRFAVFTADGPPAQEVPAAWQRIWREPLARAYRADVEVHGTRGPNTADIQVGVIG